MSVKWTGSQIETGILRKSEYKEKKEELFVFGYSCKLFRDDDKAQHIDQGKHLIPWMGDETLKIDRYDARGALHDLSTLEAPPGGFDWRVELTRAELDVEQLCDEERYRALHTDEDEEEMYKEEELKRLHAAGYGQVGFNYDTTAAEPTNEAQAAEVEEPFEPTPSFRALFPVNTVFPETQKLNAIIEKTAKFIASQSAQMEILIKAKQRDNLQFKFLNKDCNLNPYYTALIGLIKSGKWPEKTETVVEEKPEVNEEYLHPSLASAVIESAPSIPSIHYKPSADCDYTLLISKMRGEATLDETYAPELAPGEVAPPGTEPLPPRAHAEISRAPVMYNIAEYPVATNPVLQQYTNIWPNQQYLAQMQAVQAPQVQAKPVIEKKPTVITTTKSTGLSLMKNYNTDSDSDDLDFDDSSSSESKHKPIIISPPDDVKIVIDKMAAYVARNGDEFEDIVRSKNDPRFTFLEPSNIYHPFYKRLMQQKRGVDFNGTHKKSSKNDKAPVSFSIKKQKESDPVLPKPALPYESSSEDEEGKETEKQEEPIKEQPKTNIPQITYANNIMPPVVVYKMEAGQINNLPIIKTIEPLKLNTVPKTIIQNEIKEPEVKELPIVEEKSLEKILPKVEVRKERTPEKRDRERSKERLKRSPSRERKKHHMKKNYRSEYRERSESRVEERERKKHKAYERDRKRERKYNKDELESEIISLEDNSNEMIDLTGEQSDSKGEGDTEEERAKQQERRKRAAEFLKKVGVDPAAAALPTTSLASAMVDTLESLRKKKSEEEKRKRREKRRRRDKKDYEDELDKHKNKKRKKNRSSDDEDEDMDGSKKKKRKKDKKHSTKSKKKKRREELGEPQQINIDITNTLKELRSNSPTKELEMDMLKRESDGEKRKRRERDYSEGEWSSDSDADSLSSGEEN